MKCPQCNWEQGGVVLGNYNQETLSLCQHGIPVKLGCYTCLIKPTLNELESNIKDMKKLLEIHWKDREIFYGYGQDIKILKERIEKLERLYNESTDVEQGLLNRIKSMECENKKLKDHNERILFQWADIEDIKTTLNKHYEMLQNNGCDIAKLINGGYERKPHKCPVCEGEPLKEWHENNGLARKIHICVSCDGKGIVWD